MNYRFPVSHLSAISLVHKHRAAWKIATTMLLLLVASPSAQADISQPYLEPGINLYREQASEDGAESMDPYTGLLKVRHLDVLVPGNGGLDIKIWRSYDMAKVPELFGPLGLGWAIHFGLLNGQYLEIGSAVCWPASHSSSTFRPVFELPNGTVMQFYRAPAGAAHPYITKDRWAADCSGSANGGLVIFSPEGVKYDVTQPETVSGGLRRWHVKKITDKHGNWLNFDYELPAGGVPGIVHLSKITSNDGRLVNFTYKSGSAAYTVKKLASIATNGSTWLYDYVNFDPNTTLAASQNYSLAKVTRPDGRTWQYAYTPLALSSSSYLYGYMSQITDPLGGIKRFTTVIQPNGFVGSGQIRVTKKTASDGVNTGEAVWTYNYRPNVSGSDFTDVVHPAGITTYKHVSAYYLPHGSAWKAGLILERADCSLSAGATCDPNQISRGWSAHVERLDWSGQVISSDRYSISGVGYVSEDSDGVRAPILTRKTIYPTGLSGTKYVTENQSHDSYGNPGRIVETGNGVTRTTDLTYYNNASIWVIGQRDKETVDASWVIDRTFDTKGNVLSVNKYGVATTYSYYASGDVASITDAKGSRTDYSNYYRGVPRREDQPGGVVILRTVNATGTVASETNGEGYTTGYTYDGLNRLIGVNPPTGNATTIAWLGSGAGANSKRVTRGNFEETSIFDGFGRPVGITRLDKASQARVRRVFRYDGLGRKILESYPTSSATATISSLPKIEYTYDAHDRLTQIKHADGKTRLLQYLTGNQIKMTNENGKVTTYTYRSFGDPAQRQLMSVAAPVAAANMSLTRNALGQITGMTQAGIARTMQYDTRGYLVKTNHPEIGWVTYGRDAVGNPVSRSVGVAPNILTVNYAYDSRHRLIATTYPDASTPPVSLAYNKVDDVVSAIRGGVERTYDYDANRNLIGESMSVDGRTFSLGYLYDGNDAASQVTYPDGQIVNYYPDALGRSTAVSPYVTSVAYHPSGQVTGMTYTNGVSTAQSFNTRQWPGHISVTKDSLGLVNTTYGYDGLGNLTSIADSVDASYNRTLGYDAVDRLVSVTGPWGAGNVTYDGRGNILTQDYGATYSRTYTYDTMNRLASYTGAGTFSYDSWGNVARIENPETTAFHYYFHDNASNLYLTINTAGTGEGFRYEGVHFDYDANNYRAKKIAYSMSGEEITYSLYAKDGNLMMEYTPSSGDLKQFAYHNKKQVAMRHVVDPALNLGQAGSARTRFASVIPRKPDTPESMLLAELLMPRPLLTAVLLAN